MLVFNTHDRIANPTWDDIKTWLTRYAELYPVMKKTPPGLDLSIKAQVDHNAAEIFAAMSLPKDNPRSMPVTPDLSEFRRSTILAYLQSVIDGQKAGGASGGQRPAKP